MLLTCPSLSNLKLTQSVRSEYRYFVDLTLRFLQLLAQLFLVLLKLMHGHIQRVAVNAILGAQAVLESRRHRRWHEFCFVDKIVRVFVEFQITVKLRLQSHTVTLVCRQLFVSHFHVLAVKHVLHEVAVADALSSMRVHTWLRQLAVGVDALCC